MADTDVLSPDFNPLQPQPAQPAFNATQQDFNMTQNPAPPAPSGPIVSRDLSSSATLMPVANPSVKAPTSGMSPLQLGLRGALMGIAAGLAQRTAGQGAAAGANAGTQITQQNDQDQAAKAKAAHDQQDASDRHQLILANLQSHNIAMMQAQQQVKNGTLDYYSKLGQSTQSAMSASQDADGFQVYGTNMPESVVKQKFMELHQQNPQSRVTYGTDGSTTDQQGNVVPTFSLYDPGTGSITLTPEKIQSLKASGIDVPANVPANSQVSPTYLNQLRSQSVQKMALDTAKAQRDTAVAGATSAQAKAAVAPQEAQAELQGKLIQNKEGNQRIGLIQAQTAKENAMAAKDRADAAAGQPLTDPFGNSITPPPGGVKEYNKVRDSYKKDADNLSQTEQTFRQFGSILNDINAGKDITGAQSVVGLFNAIGISAEPLKGKGFRVNNNTIDEHVNARGLGQSLYQRFLGLKDGDVITPQQLKDYATIAMDARRNAYVTKYNQAASAGINPAFILPKGNGSSIDPNTVSIFMELAGGDPVKAAHAMDAAGWRAPR